MGAEGVIQKRVHLILQRVAEARLSDVSIVAVSTLCAASAFSASLAVNVEGSDGSMKAEKSALDL